MFSIMSQPCRTMSGAVSLAGLLVAVLAGGCAPALPAGALAVSGRVFLDANLNGRYDAGERGIADVPITDGVNFVRTGQDGRYRIDARVDPLLAPGKRPILSVSFPSGYWPTAGWFRRVVEREDLRNVDFPLRADAQEPPFAFVHGTDAHVPRGGRDRFIAFRREMEQQVQSVKFCILTGDNVNTADYVAFNKARAQYEFFAEQTKDFPVPLFCIPGNHDPAGVHTVIGWDKRHPMYGYGFHWKLVGPLRWSFDCAGVHFVGVDFMHKVGRKWRMGVPDSAVRWLEKDLRQVKPGTRILLFVHYPQGDKEFRRVLKEYNVSHIFAGHRHTVKTFEYAGVPVTLSGALSRVYFQPSRKYGYRLVRITEAGLEMSYKHTGAAAVGEFVRTVTPTR